MDACPIVISVDVPTDILDNNVDAAKAGGARAEVLSFFDGGGEEAATDAAGVSEGFELWGEGAENAADVVFGVDFAPFDKRGRVLCVESFEADIEVFDCIGNLMGKEGCAHCDVGVGFRCMVDAMKFLNIWEGLVDCVDF